MMLKQVFALAILSNSALGRFTPSDRATSWQGKDECQRYTKDSEVDAKGVECETLCFKECGNCTQHYECAEDEVFCGYGPPRTGPCGTHLDNCPRDELCVKDNCYCPKVSTCGGGKCPEICKCNCDEETQLCCERGVDECGCPKEDICWPKGHGHNNALCEGYCPQECEHDEHKCDACNTKPDGCKKPEECCKKSDDRSGNHCHNQYCPCCCEDNQICCPAEKDANGCPTGPDICKDKQTSMVNVGDGTGFCPGQCPIRCKPTQVKCPTTTTYDGGNLYLCTWEGECKDKFYGDDGTECPPDSDSHDCPISCPPEQIACEPNNGPNECKLKKDCKPKTKTPVEVCPNVYCPEHSDCPKECPKHHVNCPGGTDDCGCKNDDVCIPQTVDWTNNLCPVHCPDICQDDEILCPGKINPHTGCKLGDTCITKKPHQWGPNKGQLCTGWCPARCADDEILCPSYWDPCNGCPTEEVCRVAIKDANNKFCPGKEFVEHIDNKKYQRDQEGKGEDGASRRGGFLSASHNCPFWCKEWDEEIECPVYDGDLGCKPENLCKKRIYSPTKVDEEGNKICCSIDTVCPKQCASNKKLCQYNDAEVNYDGCPIGDICIEHDVVSILGTEYRCQNTYCPIVCNGYLNWPQEKDDLGCKKKPVCG